jgi:hypothetical protein
MVPTEVFLQELHEPSMSRASAEASKVAESSQETPLPNESISESPEVTDWHTPFMIHFRTGNLLKDNVERERLHHRAGKYTLLNNKLFG